MLFLGIEYVCGCFVRIVVFRFGIGFLELELIFFGGIGIGMCNW